MGAKAIKRRFMGQTFCILLGLECHMWHMRNGINVMEYFKPGEQMRMTYYSVSDTGILGKKIFHHIYSTINITSFLFHYRA